MQWAPALLCDGSQAGIRPMKEQGNTLLRLIFRKNSSASGIILAWDIDLRRPHKYNKID
jgi:hypothetical protein